MTKGKRKASTAPGEMEPPVKKHRKEAVLLDKGSIKGKKHSDKVVAKSPKLGMKKLKEKAVKGKYQKDTGGMKDSSENPDSTEFKKNKEELKKTGELQNCSIYDVTVKANQLWENIQSSDCTAENELVLTTEILGLLKDYLHKLVNCYTTNKGKREASTAPGEMEPPVKKHQKEAVLLDKGSIKEEKHLGKVVANSSKLGMEKLKEKAVNGKYQKDTGGMKDLSENPDSIEFKKNKEELNTTGELQKCSISDATVKAKHLWEISLRPECTAGNKLFLINKMHGILQGHLHEVVFESNECRIVQWLLEMGTPDIHASVAQELKHEFVLMLVQEHTALCIELILKYGSDESRYLVVECLWGHVVRLMCNDIAAPIVEIAYKCWATPQQKIRMQQEFYGDIYKNTMDNSICCLEDIWKTSSMLKDATLATMKASLTELFKKKLVASSLVHAILLDYLNQCTPEDRSEMLVQVCSLLLDLVKTGDGARVAMLCFWLGTNKDRKMGMKALKGHVTDIATSYFGHLLLLAMFDCIDDTVLLKKTILAEVTANAIELANNELGRRVLLYLVAYKVPKYLFHAKIRVFQIGGMITQSKKDITVRKAELLAAVLKPLLESIAEQTGQWLSNDSICLVTRAVLKAATGPELERVFQAIVRYISNPGNTVIEGDKVYYALAYYGIYNLLKSILQREKDVGLKGKDTFSSILMLEVTEETLRGWTTFNNGCFFLVELLECGNEPAIQELQKKLSPLLEHITSLQFEAAYILAEKLV